LQLDPNNVTSLNNLGVSQQTAGDSEWASGHLDRAIDWYRKSLDPWGKASKGGVALAVIRGYSMAYTAYRQAIAGDFAGATRTVATAAPYIELVRSRVSPGSFQLLLVQLDPKVTAAEVSYERDDLDAARRLSSAALAELSAAKPLDSFETVQRAYRIYYFSNVLGHAEYRLGHFASAEQAERLALEQRRIASPDSIGDKRDMAEISTWLAMSLARQGKLPEAAQVAEPVASFEQGLLARDHGDVWVAYELACALYAQALADPHQRSERLARATALLDRLPTALKRLHDVKQWRRMIEEQQTRTTSARISGPESRLPAGVARRNAA